MWDKKDSEWGSRKEEKLKKKIIENLTIFYLYMPYFQEFGILDVL